MLKQGKYFRGEEGGAIVLERAHHVIQWQVIKGDKHDEAHALYNFSQFTVHARDFLIPIAQAEVHLIKRVSLVAIKRCNHRRSLQSIRSSCNRDIQRVKMSNLKPDACCDGPERPIISIADGRATSC